MSKHVKSLFKHLSKKCRVSDSPNLTFSALISSPQNPDRHESSIDGDSHRMVKRCSHKPVPSASDTQASSSPGHMRAGRGDLAQ